MKVNVTYKPEFVNAEKPKLAESGPAPDVNKPHPRPEQQLEETFLNVSNLKKMIKMAQKIEPANFPANHAAALGKDILSTTTHLSNAQKKDAFMRYHGLLSDLKEAGYISKAEQQKEIFPALLDMANNLIKGNKPNDTLLVSPEEGIEMIKMLNLLHTPEPKDFDCGFEEKAVHIQARMGRILSMNKNLPKETRIAAANAMPDKGISILAKGAYLDSIAAEGIQDDLKNMLFDRFKK